MAVCLDCVFGFKWCEYHASDPALRQFVRHPDGHEAGWRAWRGHLAAIAAAKVNEERMRSQAAPPPKRRRWRWPKRDVPTGGSLPKLVAAKPVPSKPTRVKRGRATWVPSGGSFVVGGPSH